MYNTKYKSIRFYCISYFIIINLFFYSQNIDVNQMIDGRMPLHYAADYGQSEVVRYLLDKGANANVNCN